MKKISNIELGSLLILLMVTMNSEINRSLLLKNTGINTWITLIIAYLIGLIPLSLYMYISNNSKHKTLTEKTKELFPKNNLIINIILFIIFFIIAITLTYNISQFITSQYLYRTPMFVITTSLILLSIYNASKGIKTISGVGLILLIINITLLAISVISLTEHFSFDNLKPILKEDLNKIPLTAILTATNISLPLLLLLIIPKDNLDHPEKYQKTIIISYIIGALLSIIVVVMTLGVLGIYLAKSFEYPEYIFLKKVKLFGFLERVENIVSSQWIIGNFMYISLIIYYLSNMITTSKNKSKYIIPLIGTSILIISLISFKNNTYFDSFIFNIFPYIILILIPIYIIICSKIYLSNKNKKSM